MEEDLIRNLDDSTEKKKPNIKNVGRVVSRGDYVEPEDIIGGGYVDHRKPDVYGDHEDE